MRDSQGRRSRRRPPGTAGKGGVPPHANPGDPARTPRALLLGLGLSAALWAILMAAFLLG